jgi:DNA-binding CsgD family transcriptional regulator
MAYPVKVTLQDILPLLRQGVTPTEIAKKLGVTYKSIHSHTAMNPEAVEEAKKQGQRYMVEQFFELFEKGLSLPEIAKLLNVSEYSLRKHVKDNPERIEKIIDSYWADFKKAVLAHQEKLGNSSKQDALHSRKNLEKIIDLKREGYTAEEIAKILGVPRPSFSFIYDYASAEGFNMRLGNLAYYRSEKPRKQA